MKPSGIYWTFLFSLALGASYFLGKEGVGLNQSEDKLKLSALHKPLVIRENSNVAVAKELEISSVTEPSTFDREDFQIAVYAADPKDQRSTEAMMTRLRAEDPAKVSEYFMSELIELGNASPDSRAQLVFAANLFQSDELLPFWEDLALRRTYRTEAEESAGGLGELSSEVKSIHDEMTIAIRNLGIISYRRAEARRVLEEILLHPQPLSHPDWLREYAYHVLEDADGAAVRRILKGMSDKDPLKASVTSQMAGR